jgi:hypothetical protein
MPRSALILVTLALLAVPARADVASGPYSGKDCTVAAGESYGLTCEMCPAADDCPKVFANREYSERCVDLQNNELWCQIEPESGCKATGRAAPGAAIGVTLLGLGALLLIRRGRRNPD